MAFNWQGALQGGIGGAGAGGAIGSFFPGVGTGLGAGAGGILGALGGLFGGGSEGGPRRANYTPQEQDIFSMLLNQGKNQLQNPYQGFDDISNYAQNNFYQNTIPSIAERFTAMGNGQRSSAFQGALGQAGAGLNQSLAALRSQYGMQNQQNGLNTLQFGLRPAFQDYYQSSQPGFGENLLSGFTQAAPQFAQGYQLQQLLQALQAKQQPTNGNKLGG